MSSGSSVRTNDPPVVKLGKWKQFLKNMTKTQDGFATSIKLKNSLSSVKVHLHNDTVCYICQRQAL